MTPVRETIGQGLEVVDDEEGVHQKERQEDREEERGADSCERACSALYDDV